MHGRWLAASSAGPLRKFSVLRPPAVERTCFPPGSLSPSLFRASLCRKSRRLTGRSQLPLPLICSPSSHGLRRKTPDSSLLACAAGPAATQPFGYRIVRQPGSEVSLPHAASASEFAFMTIGSAVRRQSPFHPGAADAFPTAHRMGRLLVFAQPQKVEGSQPRGLA
jgi:hypothetical protein